MAPLILHNVPDDELYIGGDGVQRPYAMVFPQQDGPVGRVRRPVAETGSFGKSTRRSRSKTATPARREDPTASAADKVFSGWIENRQKQSETQHPVATGSSSGSGTTQRRPTRIPSSSSLTSLGGGGGGGGGGGQLLDDGSGNAAAQSRHIQEPKEMILRGYRSAQQQYAAIDHFEQLAGRICEDYSREAPVERRRYKSGFRDPAFTRRQPLTPEERAMVNRTDGGEHWVKVTFESAAAAEAAQMSSPQTILGHLVYAEPYHGTPPPSGDEAVADMSPAMGGNRRGRPAASSPTRPRRRSHNSRTPFELSPPHSQTSSRTADTTTAASTTGTVDTTTTTLSSGTVMGDYNTATVKPNGVTAANSEFCRVIPSARKARLLPAEQAMLPATTMSQRLSAVIPFLRWFTGVMIGSEIPRNDMGEFDWDRASFYWQCMWWLDASFGLFGGEIAAGNKDD